MTDPQKPSGEKAANEGEPRQISIWLLFGAIVLVMYFVNYRPDIETIHCNDEILATEPDVVMFGTWWCPYCSEARHYFHDNDVHYCEFDIERSEEGKRKYEEMNGRGIPVLVFGGKYRYNGYDERVVERALNMLKEQQGTAE